LQKGLQKGLRKGAQKWRRVPILPAILQFCNPAIHQANVAMTGA
jgi:hypothetical protein